MLNVYDHVKVEERTRRGVTSDWFVVDQDTMYPATILYILENIRLGKKHDGVVEKYLDHAKLLDERAWELALGPPNQAEPDERDKRAEALEIARLVFTELLHRTCSNSIQMYFPRNLKWKLNSEVQVNVVTVSPPPAPKVVYKEVVKEVEKPQKTLLTVFGLKVVKDK